MAKVELVIGEVPPSINGYYRHAGKNRYITKKGREFKEYVEWAIKAQNIRSLGEARLKITYDFHFRGTRKRDTGNYIKVIEDCLSGILFDDDEQVDELVARRHYNAEENMTEIIIETTHKDL